MCCLTSTPHCFWFFCIWPESCLDCEVFGFFTRCELCTRYVSHCQQLPPQDESSLLSSLLARVRKLGQLKAKKSSTDGERCFYHERDGKRLFKAGEWGGIMAEETAMTVKREEGPWAVRRSFGLISGGAPLSPTNTYQRLWRRGERWWMLHRSWTHRKFGRFSSEMPRKRGSVDVVLRMDLVSFL